MLRLCLFLLTAFAPMRAASRQLAVYSTMLLLVSTN
ncbi:hypothetical protein ABMB67_004469 [Halalkalibacter oceani]